VSTEYWWGPIAAGAALVVWACLRRFPRPLPASAAVGLTAVVATAFHLVYSFDPIGGFISFFIR
jgi:hypothetical protein